MGIKNMTNLTKISYFSANTIQDCKIKIKKTMKQIFLENIRSETNIFKEINQFDRFTQYNNQKNYKYQKRQNMSTEQTRKCELSNSEERKKCLDVPKDQLRLIQEKEDASKIKPEVIHINELLANKEAEKEQICGQNCEQQTKQSERLSDKCEKRLSPIKEMASLEGRDLIDFEVEPERIEPKLSLRNSQEQFRKQFYKEGEKIDIEKHAELERKEQLTPRTADRIMNQIKEDEDKQNKRVENKEIKDKDMKKKPAVIQKDQKLQKKTRLPESKKQKQVKA